MTGDELRTLFVEYFKKQNHKHVRSASLVPTDDPTLLFTNAGMVQFKRVFLGEEQRGYHRAVTSQKCVRAGGKHNDLENVGYTARHHTFFEMLGNFSFGDYFKEDAISFAWDLLLNGYKLPKEKLWVSIYLDDDEAYDVWHRHVGVPEDRIIRLGEKDNFWSMGDTGPCGPCSEIHIDRGEAFGCGKPDCRVGCDCDRYLEIWNLVFMQFNRDETGVMTPLPKPSIDTGMGLERIASVVQQTATNYETDLLLPIINKTESLSQKRYGDDPTVDVAMKVIADHSRSAAFLVGDGVLPSNEGRGYVLRRILRRAIRYGRQIGLDQPFLHETASVVSQQMKTAYPELIDGAAFITNVIQNEEMRFSETLDHGLKLLGDCLEELKAKGEKTIPGEFVFKLYDTYGFPLDIVQDVIRDEKIEIDREGFDRSMAVQKSQSRSVASFSGINDAYKELSGSGFISEFFGYQQTQLSSEVVWLVQDDKAVMEASPGAPLDIITQATPFYGESGGQVGDQGVITGAKGDDALEVLVENTVKDPTGLIIHKGKIIRGRLKKGDRVQLTVDTDKRAATARNHTATHILHAALRHIVGDHVKQAGSLVSSERLRFDFTHFSQVDPDQLHEIELYVNKRIRANVPVDKAEMDVDKALESGATALFEEKYGETVRVISLSDFSKELCGGTHVARTGDIGLFKIVGESSVASGVRRIEALTGEAAFLQVQQTARQLHEAAQLLKVKPNDVPARIEKALSQIKAQEKEIANLKSKMISKAAGSEASSTKIRTINGVAVIAQKVEADNPALLRDLADQFKEKIKSGVVVLGSASGPKAMLVAVVTKDLVGKYHAGKIIKEVAALVGGGGGGRPDMAQAGGSKPENMDHAMESVYGILEKF